MSKENENNFTFGISNNTKNPSNDISKFDECLKFSNEKTDKTKENHRQKSPSPNVNLSVNDNANHTNHANQASQISNKSQIHQQNNQKNEKNEKMNILKKANGVYNKAIKNSSIYLYKEALDDFIEAKNLTLSVYEDLYNDIKVKEQMDFFLKALESQIRNVENMKKSQFQINKPVLDGGIDFTYEIQKVFNKDKETSNSSNVLVSKSPRNISSNDNKTVSSKTNEKEKEKEKKTIPDELRERIISEIIDLKPNVKFDDVIGLSLAKQTLKEIIILPSIRPDLFTGLRSPPRGLLLFGPPGTGKTMIAKAVATECNCTFFNISASSLTSKYVGESEKLVRALFDLAYEKQPSVVFIDEIESILSKRNDNDNEASKRLKTEFLIQFDGVGSNRTAKVLIIGATNRPMELDSAVIRRLPKRIYIGAFDKKERFEFLKIIMKKQEHSISDEEFNDIASKTENYSNSDLLELCRESAYGPLRDVQTKDFSKVEKLRAVDYKDFCNALKKIRGILNEDLLKELIDWDKSYGATI